MAQFARPDSNVTTTGFTGGFEDINETSASDSDFAYTADNTTGQLEVGLTNVADTPALDTGHIVRYRLAKADTGVPPSTTGNTQNMTVSLYQGGTLIRSDVERTVGDWTTYSFTLTTTEAGNITDYTDLRIRVDSPASGGGSPGNRRGGAISWAELEVPDGVSTETGSFTADAVITKTITVTGDDALDVDAWLRQPGGDFPADAVIFGTVSGSTTADAIFFETVEVTTFTAKAEKILGGDFTVDALILSTVTGQVFTSGNPITVGSVSGTGAYSTNPSWTHSPTADDKALVVMIGSYEGIATAVTYGNKPMTKRVGLHGSLNDAEIWTLEDLSGRDDDVVRVTDTNTATVSLMLRTDDAVEFVEAQTSPYETRDNDVIMRNTFENDGHPFTSFIGVMYDRYYYNYLVNIRSAITPHDFYTIHASKGGGNEGFRFASQQGRDAGFNTIDSSSQSGMLSVHHKGAGVWADGLRVDAVIFPDHFLADAVLLATIYVDDTQENGGTTFTANAWFVPVQNTLWLRQFAASDTALTWLLNGAGNGEPWVSLHDGSDLSWYEEHCYHERDDTTSFITRTANTVAGPTTGQIFGNDANNYVFASAGFHGDWTISGQITINIWAAESANGANAALNVAFYKRTPTGTITLLGKTSRTTELGTSASAQNFTYTPPSSWSFQNGDRILIVPFIADGGGTMASGNTASLYYNTSTAGGQGDSYVTFTENLRFMYEENQVDYFYLNNRPSMDYLLGPNDSQRAHRITNARDLGVSLQEPTVDGWTDPIPLSWSWDDDKEPVWFTPPIPTADTVGYKKATFTIFLPIDSASGYNVGIAAELALTDKFGSLITVLAYGMCRNAIPTASQDTYYINFHMRRTEVPAGSRFRVRIFFDDRGGGGGSGAMTSGDYAQLMVGLDASNWTMEPFPVRFFTTLVFAESFSDSSFFATYVYGSNFSVDAAIAAKSGGFAVDALIQKTQTTGIFLYREIIADGSYSWMDMSSDTTHIVLSNWTSFDVYHGDNWETKTDVAVQTLTGWDMQFINSNVAITSDGSKIITGSGYEDTGANIDNGEVAIFSGTDWTTVDIKTPTTPVDYEHFGWRVALSPDDSALAVSVYDNALFPTGRAYAFNGTDWADQRGPWTGSTGDDLGGQYMVFNDDGTQLAISNESWISPINGVGLGYVRYGTNFGSLKVGDPSQPFQEYTLFNARIENRPVIDNDYTYGTIYWGRHDDMQKYSPSFAPISSPTPGIWIERWAGGVVVWPNSWRHVNPRNYERLTMGVISSDSKRAYLASHNSNSPYAIPGHENSSRVVLMGSYDVFIAEGPWISGYAINELKIGWDDSTLIAVLMTTGGVSRVHVYKYGQYSFRVDAVLQPGGQFTVDAVVAQYGGEWTADAILLATIGDNVPVGDLESFTADAWLTLGGFTAFGDFTADAIRHESFTASLTADAVRFETIDGLFTVDAQKTGFHVDAWIRATITGAITADAQFFRTVEVTTLAAKAEITEWYVRHALITVDALIKIRKESFYVDAVMSAATFPVNQWFVADALVLAQATGSLAVDAVKAPRHFSVSAIIGTKVERSGTFQTDAWIDLDAQTRTAYVFVDAVVDSYFSYTTFTVDAEIVDTLKEASFTADADLSAVDEVRGTFTVSAITQRAETASVVAYAQIEAHFPILVDAVIAGIFTVDAALTEADLTGSFTVDTRIAHTIPADAVVLTSVNASFGADALLADAAGDFRQFNVDAALRAVVGPRRLEVNAVINGAVASFTVDAQFWAGIRVDAFIQPYFTVGAYIESTSVVVYPPSQEGTDGSTDGTAQEGSDGTAVTATTFQSASADFTGLEGAVIVIDGVTYTIDSVTNSTTVVISGGTITGSGLDWYIPTFSSPTGDFGSDEVGSTITVDGVDFTIISVIDENTVILGGADEVPFGQGDVDWSIPSGDATDPVGNDPPITRSFKMVIEWKRPGTQQDWTDVTGDVLWEGAEFTQAARVAPGTFVLPLKGAFSQFVGGEDIRLTVDDMVVFGGFVQEVERGYVFDDDYGDPVTTLRGTDYTVVLDRRLVYNENWDIKQGGSGKYKNIKPFAEDTLDQTIIRTIAQKYMTAPWMDGFNFQSHVEAITTPAPTDKWTMQAGEPFRNVLTEISRITEGVWGVDAYKNLFYHDRGVVNAPYPITDGDGGIACRGLRIVGKVDTMANDVFVWGTEAYIEASDAEIIYRRETADKDWDIDYWSYRVQRTQEQIDKIKAIPYNKRSKKQKTRLAALRKRIKIEKQRLAEAQANPSETGSVETFGRWQHAEFRQDLLKQWAVDRRALAIMNRYSNPPVYAEATVFDPGFQAGQVVEVVSTKHGVAEELAIRQMRIDFAVLKEPVSGEYFAVPRYNLSMGLDPEDPWDTYQYLPFPDFDWKIGLYNPPKWIWPPDSDPGTAEGGTVQQAIDSFERLHFDDSDLGVATSPRTEVRQWSGVGFRFTGFFVDGNIGSFVSEFGGGIIDAYDPVSGRAFVDVVDLPVGGTTADRTASTYRSESVDYIPLTENTLSLDSPSRLETSEIEWKVRFPTTFQGRALGTVEQHDYTIGTDGSTYLTPGQAATGWYDGTEVAEMYAICDSTYWRLECQGHGRVLFTNGEQEELVDLEAGQWYNVVMSFGDVVRCTLYSGDTSLATIVATAADSPHSITIGGSLAVADPEYVPMSLEWEEVLGEFGLVATYQTIDDFSEDSTGYVIIERSYQFGSLPLENPWALTNGAWPDATYNFYWFNTHGWLRDNAPIGSYGSEDYVHDADAYTYDGEMILRGSYDTDGGATYDWPAFAYNFAFYGLPEDHPDAGSYADWVTDPSAPWNREGVIRIVFTYDAWTKAASERTNDDEASAYDNQVLTGIRVYHGLMPFGEEEGQMGEVALILPNPKTETRVADDWGDGPYPNDAPILAVRVPGKDTWDYNDISRNYQIEEADTRAVYVYRDDWLSTQQYVFEASFVDGALRARLYALGEEEPDWMVEYDGMGAYVQEPQLALDTNHLRIRYTLHNYETMRVQYVGFSATGRPVEDLVAGDVDVEPGWNTEVTPVTNGQFVISATPNPGSVNVFDPDGDLLEYPSDWVEVTDDGITYRCSVDVEYVTVTYFVDTPELGQHTPVPRATEGEMAENQPQGTQTPVT